MFKIPDQYLLDLRLYNMSSENRQHFMQEFNAALQRRVGRAITRDMSQEQLTQLEQVTATGDANAGMDWLQQAIPNYQDYFYGELQALKNEIKTYGRIISPNTSDMAEYLQELDAAGIPRPDPQALRSPEKLLEFPDGVPASRGNSPQQPPIPLDQSGDATTLTISHESAKANSDSRPRTQPQPTNQGPENTR